MEKYWPDLLNKSHPEKFWEHEYQKHGSCVTGFQRDVYYFQKALDFAQRIGDVVMTMRLSSGSIYLR